MNYPCKSRYVTERSLNSIILHRRLEAPIDGKYFVNNIICDINLISTCQVSVRIFFSKDTAGALPFIIRQACFTDFQDICCFFGCQDYYCR